MTPNNSTRLGLAAFFVWIIWFVASIPLGAYIERHGVASVLGWSPKAILDLVGISLLFVALNRIERNSNQMT